jgi:hypothetical protein
MKTTFFIFLSLFSFNIYANTLLLNSVSSFQENLIYNCGKDKHYKILRYKSDNEQGHYLEYVLQENFKLLKSKKCQNTINGIMSSYLTLKNSHQDTIKSLSITDQENFNTFNSIFIESAKLKLKLTRINEFNKTNIIDGFY